MGRWIRRLAPCSRPFRLSRSWDTYPYPIEPDHGSTQAHLIEALRPKRFAIHRPAEFRKPATQMQAVRIESLHQPPPPSPDGAAACHHPPRHLTNRLPRNQPFQHGLLALPPILAPGRQTGRQPRAGAVALWTIKARYEQRPQRKCHRFTPWRVALIVTMTVHAPLSAVGAALGSVAIGIIPKLLLVLI